MFYKERYDFQALDDFHRVKRLRFQEDRDSAAYFFSSHFSAEQITLLGHRVLIW